MNDVAKKNLTFAELTMMYLEYRFKYPNESKENAARAITSVFSRSVDAAGWSAPEEVKVTP